MTRCGEILPIWLLLKGVGEIFLAKIAIENGEIFGKILGLLVYKKKYNFRPQIAYFTAILEQRFLLAAARSTKENKSRFSYDAAPHDNMRERERMESLSYSERERDRETLCHALCTVPRERGGARERDRKRERHAAVQREREESPTGAPKHSVEKLTSDQTSSSERSLNYPSEVVCGNVMQCGKCN